MDPNSFDWLDQRNIRLYQLLVEAFPTTNSAAPLAALAQLPVPVEPGESPSGPLWYMLLGQAAKTGGLPVLLLSAMSLVHGSDAAESSAVRDQLAALVRELMAPPAPFDARPAAEGPSGPSPLEALWEIGGDDADDQEVSVEQARELFEEKFCNPHSATRLPVKPEQIYGVETIVDGKAFRFDVEYGEHGRCVAQMYLGLGDVGHRLWSQEANALIRLSGRRHLALPVVVDGIVRERDGIGIVVSKTRGKPLDAATAAWIRASPDFAVRCFSLLADGLRTLHGHGMIHRAIWRGALDLDRNDRGVPKGAQLTRFEMSAFLASLLDPVRQSDPRERRIIQRYYRRGGAASLLACSPEQLGPLLRIGRSSGFIDFRTDIYSLGVIGYEWFVGELPVKAFLARLGDPSGSPTSTQFREAYRVLEDGVAKASTLPAPLQDLLLEMLRFEHRTRPTSFDVVDRLAANYDRLVHESRKAKDESTYVVSIAPKYFVQFMRVPEWTDLSPDPTIQFEQLKHRIEKDLAPSRLLYVPEGAGRYLAGGDPDRYAESKYVLLGTRAVYFCQRFVEPAHQGVGRNIDWVLHINYAVDATEDKLRDIGCNPLQRNIRSVRVVHYRKSGEVDPDLGRRKNPLWTPNLDHVTFESEAPAWYPGLQAGLDWWLALQQAQTDVHMYPFQRVRPEEAGSVASSQTVRLRVDVPRDQAWIETNELRDILAAIPPGRPEFGDFFATLEERGLGLDVTWRRDRDGRPQKPEAGQPPATGRVVKRINRHEIEVEVDGDFPPGTGWLRPKSDLASDVLLRRQRNSRGEVYASPHLLSSLYDPWSFRGTRKPWVHAGAPLSDEGRSREILQDLLSIFPFYALQGPPGTGKTTLVSHAVVAYLERHPSARILIAAQSHYALDELATRIDELLGGWQTKGRFPGAADAGAPLGARPAADPDWLAQPEGDAEAGRPGDDWSDHPILLRVASRKTEGQVRESLKGLGDAELAENCLEAIRSPERLRRIPEPFRGLAAEWRNVAAQSLPAIRDHLWRGANIVFATCGASTEDLLGTHAELDHFDWVIVEEAGKAWPCELLMPMAHGRRWTLIGDPKQLPPYAKDDVVRIYEAWKARPQRRLRPSFAGDEAFEATFELFERLFRRLAPGDPDITETEMFRRGRSPVDMLDTQFRMHEDIARIVSDCFYDGAIATASGLRDVGAAHGLRSPDFLADRAVAWLDTGAVQECRHEEKHRASWRNPGEASVVRALLAECGNALIGRRDVPEKRLALLSPYRAQNDLLSARLPAKLRPLVHTTDSFQGREADIVVVSLVRTNDHPADEGARNRIGHVADPKRANVMLSRPRKLLVLVGDFDHFKGTTGSPWPRVCETIEKLGGIVPSTHVDRLLRGHAR